MADDKNLDWEDITPESVKQNLASPSLPATVARSAAQGLTFGFGDELEARARAAIEGADYQEQLNAIRNELEAGRQQYPITAFTSELVGGAALPGGLLGRLAAGAKTATQAAKAGATAGAIGGAAYGLGTSEEDLLDGDKEQLAKDISAGAAGGAVGGGILSGLATSVGNVLSKTGLGERVGQAFSREASGQKIYGAEGARQSEQKLTSSAKTTAEQLVDSAKQFGEEIGRIVDNSKSVIKGSDLYNDVMGLMEGFRPKTAQQETDFNSLSKVFKLIKPSSPASEGPMGLLQDVSGKSRVESLSPRDLKNISKELEAYTLLGDRSLETYEGRATALKLKSLVDDILEQGLDSSDRTAMQEARQKFSLINTAMEKLDLDRGKAVTEAGQTDLASKLIGFASDVGDEGKAGIQSRFRLQEAEQSLAKIDEPRASMMMPLKDAAERQKISDFLNREIVTGSGTKALGGITALPAQVSARAGRAMYGVRSTAPAKLMGGLMSMPEDMLIKSLQVAQKNMPDNLKRTVQGIIETPRSSRNALLYSFIQQPGVRDYFSELVEDGSDAMSSSEDVEFTEVE